MEAQVQKTVVEALGRMQALQSADTPHPPLLRGKFALCLH